jgi:hypothetical protein
MFVKQKIEKLILAVLVTCALFLLAVQPVLALNCRFYITLSGGSSVQNGQEKTVTVRLAPGSESIDVVENVTLTYDPAKLEYVSSNSNGSLFEAEISKTLSSGSVKTSRATFGAPVTSDTVVINVVFRAKVGSGNTSLQVSGQAASSNTGGYTNPSGGNATVSFTSPPQTPPPAPPTSPSPSPTPKPSPTSPSPAPTASPAPSQTPQAPGIVISAEAIQFTRASLKVSTEKPTQVTVRFGLSQNDLFFQTAQTGLATNHQISFEDNKLIPGTTFYYQVIAQDAAGKLTESPLGSFKTKGFTAKIKATDKNNKPLKKKRLTLRSEPQTVMSDEDGNATFLDVAPGNHTLEIEYGGRTYSQSVQIVNKLVTDGSGVQTAPVQSLAVAFNKLSDDNKYPSGLLIGIPLLVAILALFAVIARRGIRRPSFAARGTGRFTGNKAVTPQPAAKLADTSNPVSGSIRQASDSSQPAPGSTINPNSTKGQ